MVAGIDSAFCVAVEMRAQPAPARLEFVASFAVLVDCDEFEEVGSVFDAMFVSLGSWAFGKTGTFERVLFVSLELAVVEIGSTVVIVSLGIVVYCGGMVDLSAVVGSVVVAAVDVVVALQERCLSFLDILLPPILVIARILVLQTECPVPPEARISGGGLALKKRHWQMILHQV